MNKQDLKFKLRWWIKEHLLFYKNNLSNEMTLEYTLPSEYGDFAIHPCVRYIPQGVGGYKWWMVLSPYPNYDTDKENILLFHGAENSDKEPPQKWIFVKEVCGTHPQGYNSDPNLHFDGKELWVIWREWETENVPEDCPVCCTMCSRTSDGINFSEHTIIAYNQYTEYGSKGDTSMCPTVYEYKNELCMYGSIYAYEPYLSPKGTGRYLYKNGFFTLDGFQQKANNWFDLWHFDLFEYNGYLYQIITGQFGNAIYIGRSKDGKTFKYSKRPLYSYPFFIKKNYFYKPTAQVIGNTLYVFFPRKTKNGGVRIVMRSMDAMLLESLFVYK